MRRLSMRSLPAALALLAVGALWLFAAGAGPADADEGAQAPEDRCAQGCVNVVAVDGIIDEIQADFIEQSVRGAAAAGNVVAVVLQMDSPGVAVSDVRLDEVASTIASSPVPVSVWIGSAGSESFGGSVELAQVADSSGITPGSDIGRVGEQRLSEAEFGRLFGGDLVVALEGTFVGEEAVEVGLVDRFSPTLVQHVSELEQVDVTETEGDDGETLRTPVQEVRFSKLPLQTQLLHTAASPSVAYLLLIIGLGLLLFEFFTAGVGVAGVVGAGFAVLGAYGVAALPFTWWALALVLASMLGFAVDMQTGIPRAWTVISMAAFTVGSVFLFVEFRPTWIALAVGIAGMGVTVFSGMPAMIRTRFATPTIGREWMVGELGRADSDVDPDGTVEIRGALWRARTNRATPVVAGDAVRVVEIDGLVLEVEPEEGGAMDYREMRGRRGASGHASEGTASEDTAGDATASDSTVDSAAGDDPPASEGR